LDALERPRVIRVGRPDALLGARQCALDDLAPGVAHAVE
jgi:hypothetical protein